MSEYFFYAVLLLFAESVVCVAAFSYGNHLACRNEELAGQICDALARADVLQRQFDDLTFTSDAAFTNWRWLVLQYTGEIDVTQPLWLELYRWKLEPETAALEIKKRLTS